MEVASLKCVYFHLGDYLFFPSIHEQGFIMAIVMGNMWNIMLPFGDLLGTLLLFSADYMYFLLAFEREWSVVGSCLENLDNCDLFYNEDLYSP